MAVLLEANGLTKRYGTTIALDDVDYQVTDGITGLLGPNGAGKSTAVLVAGVFYWLAVRRLTRMDVP
jgi:ABC-type multidrug transport system ATPase subunit